MSNTRVKTVLTGLGLTAVLLPLVQPVGLNEALAQESKNIGKYCSSFRLLLPTGEVKDQQSRIALVIGNEEYQEGGLDNAVRNAKDMAKALRRLGFKVIQVLDGNQEQMNKALNCFNEKLKNQNGAGVFYYAGHAVQVEGENYLIPVNVNLTEEEDVNYRTLPLGLVLANMETANNKLNNINIIILDSSNNDPFSPGWNRSANIRGLAPPQTTRSGSLIAYANLPGRTVNDSGLFTVRILEKIEQPGLDVVDLFRQITLQINEGTGSEQVPATFSSDVPYFSFNPSRARASSPPPSLSAREFFDRGDDKRGHGDYEGAIADYTQAIRLKPDYVEAYNRRGLVRSYLEDYEGAIADYTQVIELDPNIAYIYSSRALVRYKLEDYEGSIADYTEAIKVDTSYVSAYIRRGFVHYKLEDYEEAIADYTQAIKLDPDNAWANARAYERRGNVRRNLGDLLRAISDYTQAIRFDPSNAYTYYKRGWTRHQLEDYERAIADYTQAIRFEPDNAWFYNGRGWTRNHLEDYQGAIADYTQAIRFKPNFAEAYNNRGWTRHQLEDYEGAIADYNQAIKLDPELAEAYNSRGWTRYKLEDYEGAIADYTQAIRLDPDFAIAYNNTGLVRRKLEDYEGAISAHTQAIRLDPNFAKAYYDKGFVYKKQGNRERARTDFLKAADLYQQQGNMEMYKKALDELRGLE